jgi:2-oxoglutarate ferredoxin oxidoreductase subunit beta
MGFPIRVSELLSALDGTRYIARGAVNNAANIRKTRRYIKTAFEAQMAGIGFSMVEILSPCPTNWSMEPADAADWLESNMIPVFPLGEVKNALGAEAKPAAAKLRDEPAAGRPEPGQGPRFEGAA